MYKALTSKLGKVIVTCSPLPTSSSPSHVVSIEAGLKSSVEKENKKIGYLYVIDIFKYAHQQQRCGDCVAVVHRHR